MPNSKLVETWAGCVAQRIRYRHLRGNTPPEMTMEGKLLLQQFCEHIATSAVEMLNLPLVSAYSFHKAAVL